MKPTLSLATLLFCMLLPMMTEPALAIVYVHDQGQTEQAKDLKRQARQKKSEISLFKALKNRIQHVQENLEKTADSAFWFAIAGIAGLILGGILGVLAIPVLASIGWVFTLLSLIAAIVGLIKSSSLLKNHRESLSERALFRAQFAKISGWVLIGLYILSFLVSALVLVIVLIALLGG